MTVYLVPGVFAAGGQILDSNGNVAAGALINTYAAGTTSAVNTWTTIAQNVTAANPIVCSADGRLPHEMWQLQGQAIKILLTDSVASTLGTYDNLYGIGDPQAANANSGYFKLTSIAGTANAITAIGPSALGSLSAGQLFVFVPVTTNTGPTSLTITPAGGSSLGVKAVFSLGLACLGGELPAGTPIVLEYDGTQFNIIAINTTTIARSITLSAAAVNFAYATKVTAAGLTDLSTISGNTVDLVNSGVTPTQVTSFGTVQAGAERTIRLSGTSVFVHSVSNLILPTAANITAVTGDVIQVISLGANSHYAKSYTRADGTALNSVTTTGLVTLGSITTTTAKTALVIGSTAGDLIVNWAAYDKVEFDLTNFIPVTSGHGFSLQYYSDGGTTPLSASTYSYFVDGGNSNTGNIITPQTGRGVANINISESTGVGIDNVATGGGLSVTLTLYRPASTTFNKKIHIEGAESNAASGTVDIIEIDGWGWWYGSQAAINGIKIFDAAGSNIQTSAKVTVRGYTS